MPKRLKQLWRWLRGPDHALAASPFHHMDRQHLHALLVVKAFYVYMIYLIYSIAMLEWNGPAMRTVLQPLWPLRWIHFLSVEVALGSLILFAFVASMSALIWTEQWWARGAVCIAFFLLATFTNSYGRISHGYHALFIVLALLVVLPHKARHSVTYKHTYLTVFWLVQLAFGLIYSMSGSWKVFYGIQQIANNEISTFHPYALATWTAFRNAQTNQQSLLSDVLINYPLLGWPLQYAALYLEIFSGVAAFRPSVHRVWGYTLMGFHIGTWLIMGVPFPTNLVIAALFYGMSPFAPASVTWRCVAGALPLFGDIYAFIWQRRMYTTQLQQSD